MATSRTRCKLGSFAAGAILAAYLPAAPGLELERAKDFFGMELARCSSWYLVMREVAARSYPPGLDRNLAVAQQEDLARRAFERAAEATNREIALQRSREAMATMLEKMKNSLENLPVIAEEYAYPCKALMEAPDARLQFWLEQK